MAQPIWITAAGNLGTIAEGVFYQVPLQAYEPDTEETVYFEIIAAPPSHPTDVSEDMSSIAATIFQLIRPVCARNLW